MVHIEGTAEGHGGATGFVLVGDEVLDWMLIETLRRALPPESHTPFVDSVRTLLARRERAIRRAAHRRGRKAGGSNWSAAEWRKQRQWVENEHLKAHHRRPSVRDVQQQLGLTARTERKYRRQWGVPGAWTVDKDDA